MSVILDERYARTMRRVWAFPGNDQRPAILEWMTRFTSAGVVLDVGPGDAYYMDMLRPAACTLIEPNSELRSEAARKCNQICSKVGIFSSVDDFLRHKTDVKYDVLLMIHVLFYMHESEFKHLLSRIKARHIAIVHPDPQRSITVDFERSISRCHGDKMVSLKKKILGEPTSSQFVDSHFRLPINIPDDDLAFLIAHPTLTSENASDRLANAMSFMRRRKRRWLRSNYLELPQAQVLEVYDR